MALLLPAAILAVSFQAQAAFPKVVGFAASTTGKSIVLKSDSKTAVLGLTTGAVPVAARITCLAVERLNSFVYPPMLPGVPASIALTHVAASAAGTTYYLLLYSYGQQGNKRLQVVDYVQVATTPYPAPYAICGSVPDGSPGELMHGLIRFG